MAYPTSAITFTTRSNGQTIDAAHVNDLQTEVAAIEADVLTSGITLLSGRVIFPAAQNAAAGVNTLDDYEEGTFTPTDASGASLTFTNPVGQYVKVGKRVDVWVAVTYPATANGSNAVIGSLPFTSDTFTSGVYSLSITPNNSADTYCYVGSAATTISLLNNAGAAYTNANMTGRTLYIGGTYRASA